MLLQNGGPGCSSLAGYLNELGPFHFDTTAGNLTLPNLIKNPYAWTKIANLIFCECIGCIYTVTALYYNNVLDLYYTEICRLYLSIPAELCFYWLHLVHGIHSSLRKYTHSV